METIGLYIHIPFCDGKCPYCDFYSLRAEEKLMDSYTEAVTEKLQGYSQNICRPADTLYFGGGTPSLLGAERLLRIVEAARSGYGLKQAEITVEVNPSRNPERLLYRLGEGGVNRISIGMQSADEAELRALGRRHSAAQARETVRQAKEAGFREVSLDLMLAVPGQTKESLKRSIAYCAESGVSHLSAYLLKIEPGTPYGEHRPEVPEEDEAAELYLCACEWLEEAGYRQYEISNFARPGHEGRHNLKYWHDEEYLGIGPAAHSFLQGKRFYYERDLAGFLEGKAAIPDGDGGSPEEYAMLALRLREGLTETGWQKRFGEPLPGKYRNNAMKYRGTGLLECDGEGIRMTPSGFLVSNSLISEILFG